MKPRSALAAYLVASSLAGVSCASSPEPQFYTLFPGQGPVWAGESLEVEVRRPGLPGYLDRPQIVRHEQPGKLEFSGADRWGAPLDGMIANILVQDLAQRLPSASVYGETGAISASPDALIEVDIQRFELTERGAVELVAQVAVRWVDVEASPGLQRFTLSRTLSSRSTTRLVAEMSGLLAELADSIARTLRAGPPPARPAAANGAGQPATPPSDAPEAPPR